jgi:hypothetical protein
VGGGDDWHEITMRRHGVARKICEAMCARRHGTGVAVETVQPVDRAHDGDINDDRTAVTSRRSTNMNTEQNIDDTTGEPDDTEGHRFKFVEAAGEGDLVADDAEGHGIRVRFVESAGEGELIEDDTEGHMPRVRFTEAAGEGDVVDDGTEGHAIRSGRLDPAGEGDLVDDDAEGHMYVPKDERFGGSEPRAMRGKLEAAGEDDTEGHGFRGNVEAAGEDDTEGHGFRGNLEAADEHDTEGHGFRGP